MAMSNDLFVDGEGTGEVFDSKVATSVESEVDSRADGCVTELITAGDEVELEVEIEVEAADALVNVVGTVTVVVGIETGRNGNGLLIFFFVT